MAKIESNDVVTEVSTDSGTTWKTLICETTGGFEFTRDESEAPRTKCDSDATGKTITPTGYSWSMPFDALVDDAPDGTQVTYADCLSWAVNKTLVMVRRTKATEFLTSGSAYLMQLSESSEVDGYVAFSGTFQGTGDLDITE